MNHSKTFLLRVTIPFLAASAVYLLLNGSCTGSGGDKVQIKVDASEIIHTLQAGMGASWHAISRELPLDIEKYKYTLANGRNSRGSAWGGNPPVSETAAWEQIKDHASWLGINFLRVELSQRMYEPGRKQYDWSNEEMQALFNILDWCEENNADVLLQQMWHYTEWNSLPGVHPLISAPKSLDDYAEGIATLIEYLVKERGYTCIRYFGMTNEPPGGTWGYWWEYGDATGSINDAWRRLKEEFDRRNIAIPISGPGWTDLPPFEEEKLRDIEPYFGSIDIHSYQGVTAGGEATLGRWAEWAHSRGKPFLLTEYGNMRLGWRGDNPAQKSFDAAISNATDVIRGLRVRVDGFNRWSFTNRGDLDGQWQLIRTFDIENQVYLQEVLPEKEAYYGFGILSRFFSKYSSVVQCSVNRPDSVLMASALVSPQGELTIFMVNLSGEPLEVSLAITGTANKKMNVYQVSREIVNREGFSLDVNRTFMARNKNIVALPARSITTVSSYSLNSKEKGISVR
jgi:hypothetical protein